MESSEARIESDTPGEPLIARDSDQHSRTFRSHRTEYEPRQQNRDFFSQIRALVSTGPGKSFAHDRSYRYVSSEDQYDAPFRDSHVSPSSRPLKWILQTIVSNMKLSLSLAIVPVALFVGAVKIHPVAAFSLNLVAVIPLSVALTMATESLAHDLGPTAGALLNISCGNLAEIIILTALSEGHVRIVQASLLGSLLVNLLLVFGLSLVVAGLVFKEQNYDDTSAQLFIGQLNLTVFSFILPTAFYGAMSKIHDADNASLAFSRAVSVILLLVYGFYLVMHLRSQEPQADDLLEKGEDGRDGLDRVSEDGVELPSLSRSGQRVRWKSNSYSGPAPFDYRQLLVKPTTTPFSHFRHSQDHDRQWGSDASHTNDNADDRSNEDEKQRPVHKSNWLSRTCAILVLSASTFVIGICADTVVASFRTLNERGTLRESFVGLIILPVAGNIAEVITSAMVAAKGDLDLAINVAVGSAIQIGVLVTPLTVLAGWAMRKDMSLHFNGFETVSIVAASLMVSFLLVRGKANHFEGVVLIAAYAAVSIGALLLPDSK